LPATVQAGGTQGALEGRAYGGVVAAPDHHGPTRAALISGEHPAFRNAFSALRELRR